MSSAAFNRQNEAERARMEKSARAAEIIRLHAEGQPAEALEALAELVRDEPDLFTVDAVRGVMDGAPQDSALQQAAAGYLLSLSLLLDEESPYRAAQTSWLAAEKLPPESLAGQAAIDRVLDVAGKRIERPELALSLLTMATARALPASDLDIKGRDLWLKRLPELDRERQIDEAKAAAWQTAAGSALQEKAAAIWSSAVRQAIDNKQLDDAFAEIENVIGNPYSKGPLERDAGRFWREIIERFLENSLNKALLKACKSSERLYRVNGDPSECAAVKEIMAETLLDLARPGEIPATLTYFAVTRAADYAGDNEDLHSRIAHNLVLVAHGAPRKEHREAAAGRLAAHVKFDPRLEPGGNMPPPPSP